MALLLPEAAENKTVVPQTIILSVIEKCNNIFSPEMLIFGVDCTVINRLITLLRNVVGFPLLLHFSFT